MSSKTWGVVDFGFVLKTDELLELLKSYNGKLEDLDKEEFLNDIEEGLMWDINDLVVYGDMGVFEYYSDIEGDFVPLNADESGADTIYFYDEDLYYIGLKKMNIWSMSGLFEKYENKEEIYQEIKDTLASVGLSASDDFIKNRVGRFIGTYWG